MFHTTHQSVTVRLLLILMSAGSPAAAAAAPHVLARAMMSGPAGLAGVCGPGAGANNPLIAADPLNPKRLVATYLIGANGDGVGIVAARSEDAGRTWRRTALEGMTRCEGGRVNFVGDPYLAYGPGEHVYIDASGLGEGSAPTADNLYLAASTDGGASYHRPIEPAAGHTSQRGAISPDPRHPGSLALEYESFDPISGPLGQTPWTVALASSHNSARTFATPRILETTQPGTAALAVALLRSRTVLVAISAEINLAESDGYLQGVPGSPLIEHVLARRSHNNGLTFGPPSPIGTLAMKLGDPGGCCLISTTQAADGTLYATWTALSAAGAGEVLVYRSHDTGATWQQLPVARTATRAFESSVATNPNGHVGVLWLQYAPGARGTAAATGVIAHVATSSNHGRTWSKLTLNRPIQPAEKVNLTDGGSLGEYQGITGLADGFAIALTTTSPPSPTHPTTTIRYLHITG